MNRFGVVSLSLVALLQCFTHAADGEWGHLNGRFTYDGDPPTVKTIQITSDNASLGDTIADDSLIVNPDNGGIANIVVFLSPDDGGEPIVHPSYTATADTKIELAMERGRFSPRVLLLRTTQTLALRNKDAIGYNAHIDYIGSTPTGSVLPASSSFEVRYTKEEKMPIPLTCNIHPWMHGYLLLRSNPYMAQSDGDGRFAIENLPCGVHSFRVWHERAGYLRYVTSGSLATDSKGRLAVTIRKGRTEVIAFQLSPRIFDSQE